MSAIPAIRRGSARAHGMTLVEILIALAIASLMTLTGWRAIDALQTSRDRVIADASTWQRIDDLFATLEADLRRASLTEFSGNSDSLMLLQPAINGNPTAAVVRYSTAQISAGMNDNGAQPALRITRDGGSAHTPGEARHPRLDDRAALRSAGRGLLGLSAVAAPHHPGRLAAQERATRGDDEPVTQGLAPDEHAEPHLVAVAQSHLDVDGTPHELDAHRDDVAVLHMTG